MPLIPIRGVRKSINNIIEAPPARLNQVTIWTRPSASSAYVAVTFKPNNAELQIIMVSTGAAPCAISAPAHARRIRSPSNNIEVVLTTTKSRFHAKAATKGRLSEAELEDELRLER